MQKRKRSKPPKSDVHTNGSTPTSDAPNGHSNPCKSSKHSTQLKWSSPLLTAVALTFIMAGSSFIWYPWLRNSPGRPDVTSSPLSDSGEYLDSSSSSPDVKLLQNAAAHQSHHQQQQQQQQQQAHAASAPSATSTSGSSVANTEAHSHDGLPQWSLSGSDPTGAFPKGCKWRDVQTAGGNTSFWAIQTYEYWDDARGAWTPDMPSACKVKGLPNPGRYDWKGGSPRTEVNCTPSHCIYDKLWYNNGRYYLLVDGEKPVVGWKLTRNQDLHVVHVDDAKAFVNSIDHRILRGDTLIADYIYFLHPTAIGHWSEMMHPLYSILKREPNFARPVDQLVLLHLKRVHLMEWGRAVIAATLGTGRQVLPPLIMQTEVDSVWGQIPAPLEGFAPHEWVCFERALVVRDIFTGGTRTWLSGEDAQTFRRDIYKIYDLPVPMPRRVPRIITFQMKRANRRIINQQAFLDMFREFGEVRIVEFNASTPFQEQLRTISETGIFVGAHTSNLANAHFLQPGSAVVEVIQRNWAWNELDKSFVIHTSAMGDIHHFAWRARHSHETVYINKRDGERFSNWSIHECMTEDCVEAHTNVDIIVNLEELRALLRSRLPLVFNSASVKAALAPWPSI